MTKPTGVNGASSDNEEARPAATDLRAPAEFHLALNTLCEAVESRQVEFITHAYMVVRNLARGMQTARMLRLIEASAGADARRMIVTAFSHASCLMCSEGTTPCLQCSGIGVANGHVCPPCDGFGVVPCGLCRGTAWADLQAIPHEMLQPVLELHAATAQQDFLRLHASVDVGKLRAAGFGLRRHLAKQLVRLQARAGLLQGHAGDLPSDRRMDFERAFQWCEKVLDGLVVANRQEAEADYPQAPKQKAQAGAEPSEPAPKPGPELKPDSAQVKRTQVREQLAQAQDRAKAIQRQLTALPHQAGVPDHELDTANLMRLLHAARAVNTGNSQARQSVEPLKAQLAQARAQVADTEAQIARLESNRARQRESIATIESQIEQLERAFASLTDTDTAGIQAQLDRIEAINVKGCQNKQHASLSLQLRAAQELCDRLAREVESASKDHEGVYLSQGPKGAELPARQHSLSLHSGPAAGGTGHSHGENSPQQGPGAI